MFHVLLAILLRLNNQAHSEPVFFRLSIGACQPPFSYPFSRILRVGMLDQILEDSYGLPAHRPRVSPAHSTDYPSLMSWLVDALAKSNWNTKKENRNILKDYRCSVVASAADQPRRLVQVSGNALKFKGRQTRR